MDMNTVISWGLAIMGGLSVCGWIIISVKTGTSSGTEVPIAVISGLTGVLTGKNIAENKIHKENLSALNKVTDTASETQNVVDNVNHIKDGK